jgi:hypothetical protein
MLIQGQGNLEQPEQDTTASRSKVVGRTQPKKAISSRKIEANCRNAQRSTGPKTPEGKAKSSQNSITHGIFVKKFLSRATPETVAEIEALAAGLREHYQPVGMLEEFLVQKIVLEIARDHRILGLEQEFSGMPMLVVTCLDRMVRYTTSTSRALYRAIQELERVQAARKAAECQALVSGESADSSAKPETEQNAPRAANIESGASSTSEDDTGATAA